MPKKKGKVAILRTAGFASKYVGTPYVSTIYWKMPVNLFVLTNVGRQIWWFSYTLMRTARRCSSFCKIRFYSSAGAQK